MCEQKYAIWFANSTRFIDESRVPTKPRHHPAHDGTSFDDRSFQIGASHMKDHGFSKGDVSIQTPVAGDFIVWPHKNFHGTQSPLYLLIGQNPNPTDRTSAPLDAPRSNGDPHPFRQLGGVAGFGRHTAFINEPCAIRKPDCIFLFTHTVVRSIECATSVDDVADEDGYDEFDELPAKGSPSLSC